MSAKQPGAALGVDAETLPRLAALLAEDEDGALAEELVAFRSARPRERHTQPVAVALLQAPSREALAVMQDLSASGVTIRVDRRHRSLIDADVELVVNDGGEHASLPVKVEHTDECGRDIHLSFRFGELSPEQQRLVERLQAPDDDL